MLKGGVSKSLLSTSLYWYLRNAGHEVGLVDGDTQKSLVHALDKHDDVPVISRDQIGSWSSLERVKADYIVIDTPPAFADEEIKAIFRISDFVLMPCRASEPDLRSLLTTIEWYQEIKAERPSLKAAIVETQGKPNTISSYQFRQAMMEAPIPLLSTRMMHRVAYNTSWSDKGGIYATDNRKAQHEIDGIANEILNLLNHG